MLAPMFSFPGSSGICSLVNFSGQVVNAFDEDGHVRIQATHRLVLSFCWVYNVRFVNVVVDWGYVHGFECKVFGA